MIHESRSPPGSYLDPGILIPTGLAEPVRSGTGLPIRFVRKPVKTREIQISNKNHSSIGLDLYTDRYTGPVRLGTGR
jgi:hypothetical protein